MELSRLRLACFRMSAGALAAAWAGTALAADKLDELWSEGRHLLEPAGISKPMFRSIMVWSEGQYHIGYCSAHLQASDVAYWRNWWARTIVPDSGIGRELIAEASATYEDGLKDGGAQMPSGEFCRRTLDSWSRDMDAANEAALAERVPDGGE